MSGWSANCNTAAQGVPLYTVLLVDDDPDIREIGRLALEHVGSLAVQVAATGADAVAVASKDPPDVILLDVMMPDLSGPETLRLLRESPRTASIPVVFLTANVQRQDVDRYKALGASGVIGKPFDPMTLADRLRRLVGGD